MPRRNFLFIMVVAAISFACYRAVDHDPYGRYFAEVLHKVDRMYVEPVDREKLFGSAVNGMLQSLDEHSEFIPEPDRFLAPIEQHYGGIGIEVFNDPAAKKLTVLDTIVGSPAYKAGILGGDEVVAIGDQRVEDITLDRATESIRGPIGSTVRLTLSRAGHAGPIEVTLTRADIKTDSVLGDHRNADDSWNFWLAGHPHIGYIRLKIFGDRTTEELRTALDTMKRDGIEGLILDLRYNGGGRLDAAVEVCSLFIPKGEVVVTTKGRDGNEQEVDKALGPGTFTDFPMAVLINSSSASASEITAACLQDHQRAVIVGQRSYGKGTVQRVLHVEDNRAIMKLTTAYYWRPSNKNINRLKDSKDTDVWGVLPDAGYAVELTKDQTEKMLKNRTQRDAVHGVQPPAADAKESAAAPPDIDPQLQKALDYIEHHRKQA